MKVNLGIIFFLLGILIVLFETFSPTLYLFPVGLGFIVSGLTYYFTGNFLLSLLLFFLLTSAGYYVSLKYVKRIKGLKDVLSELKKQTGIVVGKVDQFTYEVRFPLGAAGEEVWNAYSEKELSYGDRVKVVGIKGNKLVVEKVDNAQVG
ncbi:membrane protein implicated in regulation of membrane protease activity [Thermovibrio guaymasensis]|uniref:Membrane protein implicated in regulation of membrane protease activity n=1 Tax=Thermovibrio guaymasensis TaxID=240167 RepID=A0A420W7R5_9BACT|nr:NfeD family protein [Thermovibrio guaymasensis]RKQ63344.1 membrane protein implicated in regulation of membrane protease activity [Thermovibrio guaymasensis]